MKFFGSSTREYLRPILCLAALLVTTRADAGILFDQMTNFSSGTIASSWVSPDGSDEDTYAYDNFSLKSDSNVNEVKWVGGGGSVTGFTVRFYTGLASAPSYQPTITALPENETSADYLKGYTFSNADIKQTAIAGTSLFQYDAVLPTSLSLSGNTVYWIKIEADAVGYPFWGVATATNAIDSRHISYFTGLAKFLSGPGSEAFQLSGTSAAVPEPGSISLIVLGLAMSTWAGRRAALKKPVRF